MNKRRAVRQAVGSLGVAARRGHRTLSSRRLAPLGSSRHQGLVARTRFSIYRPGRGLAWIKGVHGEWGILHTYLAVNAECGRPNVRRIGKQITLAIEIWSPIGASGQGPHAPPCIVVGFDGCPWLTERSLDLVTWTRWCSHLRDGKFVLADRHF